ncbi:MAG: hypothetical protein V8Q82_07345 [Christensenellales bacterium]
MVRISVPALRRGYVVRYGTIEYADATVISAFTAIGAKSPA